MKFLSILLCLFLLAGCGFSPAEATENVSIPTEIPVETTLTQEAPPKPTVPPDPIRLLLNKMSLEERVGQLFLARCDDAAAIADIERYHLGGFLFFGRDFQDQTPDSFRAKIAGYQAAAKLPLLLAVDEEGGTVVRISSNRSFSEKRLPSARDSFSRNGLEGNQSVEAEKCRLLQSLGLNVNLGPVCDISTQKDAFMYQRSLGQNADITSQYVSSTVSVMKEARIGSTLKHFPGYGNNDDTHTGIAVDRRSLQELEGNDLIPFAAGIDAGCDAILMSHTIVQAFDDELPISLSPAAHQYLRETMGFTGVIMTDDLVMQAITDTYGAGEAAVMAVLAGNDLLCSTEYAVQYDAVLAAVLDGRIDIDVLNSAVRHVLEWKISLGLL